MPVVDFDMDVLNLEFIKEGLATTKWIPEGRDEFLDGIIESNGNDTILFEVEGCSQNSNYGMLVTMKYLKIMLKNLSKR